MIDGLVAGKLFGFAEQRKGKNETHFVVAKVLATPSEGDSLFVNVIAFNADACKALLALQDGDTLALAGNLTPKVWTDKQGNTKPSLDMVAHQILSVYHVGNKRDALDATYPASAGTP